MNILKDIFKFVEPAASLVIAEFAKNLESNKSDINKPIEQEDNIYHPMQPLVDQVVKTAVGAVVDGLNKNQIATKSSVEPYDQAKKEKYKYNF